MDLVYYTAVLPPARRALILQRLRTSIMSLRAQNDAIPVRIYVYGMPLAGKARAAFEALDVDVIAAGSYERALRRHCRHANVLADYPVMHKWLALERLMLGAAPPRRLLYVDADTFFFQDPTRLMASGSDFVAREEPHSVRSPLGSSR